MVVLSYFLSFVMNDTDTQVQCQLIEKKRQMLASLIRVAQGVNKHTQGLEHVLLLSRPSQTFPPKIDEYIKLLEGKTSLLSDAQLSEQSEKCDARSKQLINTLLEAVDQTQKQIEGGQELESFSEEIQQQLKEFKSTTQTAVGLRAMLKKRGVILSPVQFGFPQEWISEQIDTFHQTNRDLRTRVKALALELIVDVKQLMKKNNLSQVLRDGLSYAESSMQENLNHLKAGGSIDTLPYEFDNLVITSMPEPPEGKIYQSDPEEIPVEQSVEKKQLSFIGKVKLWLSSSWKTRWRDL